MDQKKIIARYELTLSELKKMKLTSKPITLSKGEPFIDYGEKTKKNSCENF